MTISRFYLCVVGGPPIRYFRVESLMPVGMSSNENGDPAKDRRLID
jgi:hypothetical protein